MPGGSNDRHEFLHRVAIVWFAALALGIVWALLREIVAALLTLFGALLFAVFLDACARWIGHWLRLGRRTALTIVLVVMLLAFGGFFAATGPSIVAQTAELAYHIPAALQSARDFVDRHAWSRDLLNGADGSFAAWDSDVFRRVTGIFSTAFGAWSSVAIALVVAVFVAYVPFTYLNAALRLVPPATRSRAHEVFDQLGQGLRWWLVGRVASMLVVGVMTYVGLLIVDVPLALTLALIATVLSFVPYLGPILSALPAMLIALTDDPTKALVVAALYAGIQVVEGNAITPIIQQRALRLPAALLVATQFVMGALLGIGGIFLSTPFLVVVVILVQMLYVESALGEDVDVMGSH